MERGGKPKLKFIFALNLICCLFLGIRPWLMSDFTFRLSALGRENAKCVKALHDFTNQVRIFHVK